MEDQSEDDFKALIRLIDIDGDMLSIASPWDDHELMMRIENDGVTTGFIINLPTALAIMSVLLPLIQGAKLKKAWDEFMNPEKDFF
jgi:hypothetical protein